MSETGHPHILVADDDPDIREVIRFNLSAQGFKVSEAADGEELLERLRQGAPPDLVLLDITMPGASGWGVLAQMRREPEIPEVRVIILTAHDDPDFKRRAKEMGVVDYVTKPFFPKDLVDAVREALFGSGDAWRHG